MARPRPRSGPFGVLAALLAASTLLAAACADGGSNGGRRAETATAAGVDATGATGATDTDVTSVRFTRFDDEQGTFAEYAGRPIVVNFFASWCAPCVREMPEIERVHQELGDRVAFVGVDVRDRVAEGRKLAEQTGVTYELVRDPSGEVLTAFGGAVLPTTAFVTAEGRIARLQNHTYDAAELRAAVNQELLG